MERAVGRGPQERVGAPTRARASPPGGGPERAVVRGPQKAGSLCCDVGTGVNIPVVPSREERCPAAGEGTAAAGTKSSGGRSRVPGRREPWTGERPDGAPSEAAVEANRQPRLEVRPGRVPKRATHGPMKAWATSVTAEAREEARQGPAARHPRADEGMGDVRNRRVEARRGPEARHPRAEEGMGDVRSRRRGGEKARGSTRGRPDMVEPPLRHQKKNSKGSSCPRSKTGGRNCERIHTRPTRLD